MSSAAEIGTPIDEAETLVAGLVRHGLLVPSGSLGVWGRGASFERVVNGIERLITRETAADGALSMRFPPVIGQPDFERSGFLKSFPHLAGAVRCFEGDHTRHQQLLDRIEAGDDWSDLLEKSGVVLVPAACYPVYPSLRGRLPPAGALVDVSSYCFRHEPSEDPTRMVAFRMREHVRVGTPDDVVDFRNAWIDRAQRMFAALEVPAEPALANDPFFGRGGRFLALNQREQSLKFELCVAITSEQSKTPVMSFNYHQDHFGSTFEIETADGATAHTACVGFGLERIALALFKTHGFELEAWPRSVRELVDS